MAKQDIYYPHRKQDFRNYYYEADHGKFYTYKILRQLTEEERIKEEYNLDDEESEEIYLALLSNGEECHIFDIEILKDSQLAIHNWYSGLLNIVDRLEYDDEMMEIFIKECKIEKFIEKYM